jgi:hypothetical protein
MKKFFVVLLCFFSVSSVFSSHFESSFSLFKSFEKTESVSKKLMPIDDLLVSTLGGFLGFYGGVQLSSLGGSLDQVALIIMAGPPVGSVAALNTYGKIRGKDGNFWGSIIGSSLGALGAFGFATLSSGLGMEGGHILLIYPFINAIGTTIGYNF